MKNSMNVRLTGQVDVRNNNQVSRIRLLLAGGSLAGVLLMSGLFGLHSSSGNAQTIASQNNTVASQSLVTDGYETFKQITTLSGSSAAEQNSQQMGTVPFSYTASASYVSIARQAAIKAGISPVYFVRQIQQESGFNPKAVSPAGAIGIAQFMPATAASLGINPHNPVQSLYGAARLMASLSAQFGGNYGKALAAYNAGSGAVNSAVRAGGSNWLAYMPAETRHYVAVILG